MKTYECPTPLFSFLIATNQSKHEAKSRRTESRTTETGTSFHVSVHLISFQHPVLIVYHTLLHKVKNQSSACSG